MKLNCTLTGTTNEFLAPRLPLPGEIAIHEVGTNGRIIAASFRIRDTEGSLGVPVEVKHPAFTVAESDTPLHLDTRPLLNRATDLLISRYRAEGAAAAYLDDAHPLHPVAQALVAGAMDYLRLRDKAAARALEAHREIHEIAGAVQRGETGSTVEPGGYAPAMIHAQRLAALVGVLLGAEESLRRVAGAYRAALPPCEHGLSITDTCPACD